MLMAGKCKKDVTIHDAAGNINIKCDFCYSPLGAVTKAEYKERGQLVQKHEHSSK